MRDANKLSSSELDLAQSQLMKIQPSLVELMNVTS
jgi:hypothetical protein